ncbi:hypothetical protein HPP92_017187 [Vanilla planifolia]|uniref:HTH myb-type domain-containing protein n=1 Tax=Vanilla planifolia TaxID=51239 RepID=A0A835ULQ2_VANPL|nr:hypothetical protein HPP92_017187 [Vanilla planifolia]
MGSLAPEIGLDLKLFTRKTVDSYLKDETAAGGRAIKIEEIVCLLEEERRKIEAFKRELPNCMLLLNDVISSLKLDLQRCQEERETAKAEKESKMEWMSSAQLWSSDRSNEIVDYKRVSVDKLHQKAVGCGESHKRRDIDECRSRSGGCGAFMPFKSIPTPRTKEEDLRISFPDLSLVSPAINVSRSVDDTPTSNSVAVATKIADSSSAGGPDVGLRSQHLHPRKARRCWSPELHRRFVIALQQLGGAQVATPKQIRELMKVDGLTNDEVKSHLQKYRLHTRRMPNSSINQVNRPLIMVGGMWVSQDQCSVSQQNTSQSRSPQGPLQLACAAAQALSVTGGDSCEDDGKSVSYSRK